LGKIFFDLPIDPQGTDDFGEQRQAATGCNQLIASFHLEWEDALRYDHYALLVKESPIGGDVVKSIKTLHQEGFPC
jgi:hypothetical protein